MKKNLSVILVVSLLAVMLIPTIIIRASTSTEISPLSVRIRTVKCSVSVSGSRASVYAYVAAATDMSLSGTLSLQRNMNGTWTTLRNFSLSGVGSVMVNESVYLSVKGEYRIRLFVTADGIDKRTAYSYDIYN